MARIWRLADLLAPWRIRRARIDAVAAIAPHIARSRSKFGELPDAMWSKPYMLGFVTMLITLTVRRRADLGAQGLGLVQLHAWHELTGQSAAGFGEQVCLLDAAGDVEFMLGCRAAEIMASAIHAAGSDADRCERPREQETAAWERCFESRIWSGAP